MEAPLRDLKSNPLHLEMVITTLFCQWRFLSGILIEGGREGRREFEM